MSSTTNVLKMRRAGSLPAKALVYVVDEASGDKDGKNLAIYAGDLVTGAPYQKGDRPIGTIGGAIDDATTKALAATTAAANAAQKADLAAPTGAGEVGYGTMSVQESLAYVINLADSMTPAERVDAAGPSVLDHTAALTAACTKAGLIDAVVQVPHGWKINTKRVNVPKLWLVCTGTATIRAVSGATVLGQALLAGVDVRLLGVSVDGMGLVDRLAQATANFEFTKGTLKSVVGTATQFACLVRAPVGCKLRMESFRISDVSGVENGTIGDTAGADCGIYVESDDFIFRDADVDNNIGGWEDGDAFRIQLVADADLLWGKVKTGEFHAIRAPEFKKRVIKYQASGGVIDGVFAGSTATSATDSPYAAVDLYGSRTKVRNCDIDTARAVAGIIDNGIDNVIEASNSVRNAVGTGFTTARGSTLSAIRTIGAIASRIDGPAVACGGTQTLYLQNSSKTRSAIRLRGDAPANHSAIYVDGGDGNIQSGSVAEGGAAAKLQYFVNVSGATRNLCEANQVDNAVALIRYQGVVTGSKNGRNIMGAGVSSVSDYTGVNSSSAQTIQDSDGSVTGSINPGSIAAGATYTADIAWLPMGSGAVVSGGPVSALEAGLVDLGPVTGANKITIQIRNTTAGAIVAAARNWKYRNPA